MLASAARLVDTGGSVVVTPDMRNLSEIGYSLCDYQDEIGESEGLRAEYYAITHVKSAQRRTSVGPKGREGCGGGKSTTVVFRECQKQVERRAGIRLPAARCRSPLQCVAPLDTHSRCAVVRAVALILIYRVCRSALHAALRPVVIEFRGTHTFSAIPGFSTRQ